jgi:plasmid stabilization system protein ParE
MKLFYAPRARQDIADIYDSIAANNPAAALRVESAIRTSCEGLVDFPFSAPATDIPNLRRLPLGRYPYTIFYRLDLAHDLVEVARVIHGARVKDLGQLPSDNE